MLSPAMFSTRRARTSMIMTIQRTSLARMPSSSAWYKALVDSSPPRVHRGRRAIVATSHVWSSVMPAALTARSPSIDQGGARDVDERS